MPKLYIFTIIFSLGMLLLLLGLFVYPGLTVVAGFVISGLAAIQIIKIMRAKYYYKGVVEPVANPYVAIDALEEEENEESETEENK